VTDWTPVATAAISASSAVAGGALGYLTARYQSNVELRRVEAESERLKLQLSEPHLQHRQAVYHDFLDSAHRFHQAQAVEPFANPDEYFRWARDFEHYLSAVRLFGIEPASNAAQALADAIFSAMASAPNYVGEAEDRFLRTWEECIQAMRQDTAPS
jgi:hypothetical protein